MIDEIELMGLRDGLVLFAALSGYDGAALWAAGAATVAFALSLVVVWGRIA